jgi:restriction system protein
MFNSSNLVIVFFSLFVGFVLLAVILKIRRKKRYDITKITVKDIDLMTGHEFEDYLYVFMKALGYEETFLTKKSRDFGADLLFRDRQNQLTVVQAKRLSEKLGLDAVQQIYAAQAFYGADKSLIITSAEEISDPCRKLAAATKVTVITRSELNDVIRSFKRGHFEEAQDWLEETYDLVDYKAEDSMEVIEEQRGLVQAGEYFYKKSSRSKQRASSE